MLPDLRQLAKPTIFSVFQPIAEYLEGLRRSQRSAPEVEIGAIDYFALFKLLECGATPTRIIDCAADATHGASTAFFLSQPAVEQVFVTASEPGDADWHHALKRVGPSGNAGDGSRLVMSGPRIDRDRFAASTRGRIAASTLALMPADVDAERLTARIDELLSVVEDAVVVVLPVGPVGRCATLNRLVPYAAGRTLGLSLVRECSPFLVNSRLCSIYPDAADWFPLRLDRLRRYFTGNCDFLTVVQDVGRLTDRCLELEKRCADLESRSSEWESRCLNAESNCGTFAADRQRLGLQVDEILRSKAWSVSLILRGLRIRLFPPNGRRERLGRWGMSAIRFVHRRLRNASVCHR